MSWNKGRPWSEEVKEKNRLAHIGKIPWNKGTKGVMKAWNKGKKGIHLSPQSEFKEGFIPWNKGTHIYNGGGFKKGNIKSEKSYSFGTKENNPLWKGGRFINKQGYVHIYKPEHPFRRGNHVMEHRFVMEQILGRYLKKGEGIHHKNGIRHDNRPENLHLYVRGKNWHPCSCPKCGFEFLIK